MGDSESIVEMWWKRDVPVAEFLARDRVESPKIKQICFVNFTAVGYELQVYVFQVCAVIFFGSIYFSGGCGEKRR